MCLELSPSGVPELFAAFAKAQADMGDVVKGATNPAFKSKYADLAAVVAAVMPAMSKHGLAVIQAPAFDGERVSVETIVAHSAGGWMRSTLHLRPTKVDPQGVGSALTYARRYALLSVAGVAPEDDDGVAASGEGQGGQRFTPQPRQEARREPVREPATKPLADRAGLLRSAMVACDNKIALERVWAQGKRLRDDLDRSEPDILADLEGLYERQIDALPNAVAQQSDAEQVFS